MTSRLQMQSARQSTLWTAPEDAPRDWTPHAYQQDAMRWLLTHPCGGVFANPGKGKTTMMLGAFKVRKEKGLARKALVVTTVRPVHMVWPRELWKWRDFHGFTFRTLHGPKKDGELEAEAKEPSDLCFINTEGLAWLFQSETVRSQQTGKKSVKLPMRRAKELGFDTLILDELSLFKHASSLRFKLMRQLLPTFTTRWGGTGSPASNSLEALFSETYMMDLGRTFTPYITNFRRKYFVPAFNGFGWTPQEDVETRIFDAVKPVFYRIEPPPGVVQEPEIRVNEILIDLPEKARGIYDEMEKELVALVEEGVEAYAANQGVLVQKLRQIANGGIYLQVQDPKTGLMAPRETKHLHDAKTQALEELVEELQGAPLFVAYEFEHDLERLRAALGKDTPVLGGSSITKALEIQAAWNRGEIPVLLAHPKSVGHGLNLQLSCRNVCWYSMTYDRELYDQFNQRVARQGNPASEVMVHRIQGRDTVDRAMAMALHRKGKTERALYDALLEYAKVKN